MLKRFIDLCASENIFCGVKGLVVAVSGGADSLALADLLINSRQRFGLELCIAHYEHGWRGTSSLEDADFVRSFAESSGVKFICEHGDVRSFAEANKVSLETAARTLRYEFLSKVRCELDFDAIALAHHADDQAETILMRLIRGATSTGLAGMRFRTPAEDFGLLIRPLLRFRKVELEGYCARRHLTPRIDATNFETDATRNRIRLELMPTMEGFNPALVETLCRLGETSAEEADFISESAERVFGTVVKRNSRTGQLELWREEFLKLPVALQRVVVRKFVEQVTGSIKDFGFVHFEGIRKVLLNNLSGVELPKKLRANLIRKRLTIGDEKVER